MALKKKSNIPDLEKVSDQLKKVLPPVIANLAKNHYLNGFRKGGGQTNASSSGWAERKKLDKNNRGRRAILVRTGQLRNDIDVRKTTFQEIVLGTLDTGYASFINEGTPKMPQREFLGDSRKLDMKLQRRITKEMNKFYK